MNRIGLIVLGVLVAGGLLVLSDTLFVVNQIEEGLVLQFGRPVREIQEPGLYAKIPFTQSVILYDRRVLDYELPAEEVIAADQKRLVVDTYVRYRIVNPLQFYQSVGEEDAMKARLGSTISASIRRVVGNQELAKLLSPSRSGIMESIRDDVKHETTGFGIDIIDLRIRRADLPPENSQAIYSRMQSERQREAKQFRAQGYEVAQGIRATADRDRVVILADATKQSQILRGQGDAESVKIYADAYGQDPAFYGFYRSLQAYRNSLEGNTTTFVLSPDSEFLKYFGRSGAPAPAARSGAR